MELALRESPLTPSCSEHQLVAAVRRGDDRAFEELFARYRSRISSYIFGLVGDHGRAEDIAQEVFISALRRIRNSERPIAFKPWIYEIAKNACIDEFRRSRRTKEVSLDCDDGPVGGERALASLHPTPDLAIESKQRLDDLRGAFHGLSENHHRLIVMRELEGLSYSQIGERMGMSRSMVESTLFRARRRLTEEYEELVSGRRCEVVRMAIDAGRGRSLKSLGIRQRRQLARHLAHCQPCRRHARVAGVDESVFHTPSLAGKIAALLPIPWLRWRRPSGKDEALATTGSHPLLALQSLPSVAPLADVAASSVEFWRAAAAAATLMLAGAGGGLVTGLATSGQHPGSPNGATAALTHAARAGSPTAGGRSVAPSGASPATVGAAGTIGASSPSGAAAGGSGPSAASPPAQSLGGSGTSAGGMHGAGSSATTVPGDVLLPGSTGASGVPSAKPPALDGLPGGKVPGDPSSPPPALTNLPGPGSPPSSPSLPSVAPPGVSAPGTPAVQSPDAPGLALPPTPSGPSVDVPSIPQAPSPATPSAPSTPSAPGVPSPPVG